MSPLTFKLIKKMKKQLFPLILLSVLIFSSCSNSDNENNETISTKIQGKWYDVSTTVNGEETPALHAEGCERDYLFFTQNSSKSHYFDNFTGECIHYTNDEHYFTISGNQLILQSTGRKLEIIQLDDETLEFYNNETDINNDGQIDEIYMLYSRN